MSGASYLEIKEEVRRRIQAQEWASGALIPSEKDLASEFQCARATVNRALRELASEGLLDRRRRAGTRVNMTPVRKATLAIPITRIEVENTGAKYRHKVLSAQQRAAPAAIRAQMNLDPGEAALHLVTLHLADDLPFLLEDRWVNIAAVPAILKAPLEEISANEWLVQNVPISAGDIAFSAAPADASEAEALGIVVGSAVFVVDRTTQTRGQTVTKARLVYPPGYRMQTHI